MTVTDGLTLRELAEKAIADSEAAEAVLIAKGAAATAEDFKAADDAQDYMIRIVQRWASSKDAQGAKGLLTDASQIVDGKTFDDLASASGVVNPQGMTLGEAYVKSPVYQEILNTYRKSDGTLSPVVGRTRALDIHASVTDFFGGAGKFGPQDAEGKTLFTGASQTSAGAFIVNQRLPVVADLAPLRVPAIWDLCTKVPVTGDTIEWVEITSRTNSAAFVPEAISSAQIVAGVPTNADAGVKPESGMAFAEKSQKIETIAHWVPLTRRAAADAPQLMTIINEFLVDGLATKVDADLLNANGTSPNIRGILNATTPWNISVYDMSNNSVTSRLDAAALAIATMMSGTENRYMPNAIVVHPLDWFSTSFVLAKDGQSQYLTGGPFTSGLTQPALWGLRVVLSKDIAQGTQLIGDFTRAIIGDRMQSSLFMTDSHNDLFIRNILVALAEMRCGLAVTVPAAFSTIVA